MSHQCQKCGKEKTRKTKKVHGIEKVYYQCSECIKSYYSERFQTVTKPKRRQIAKVRMEILSPSMPPEGYRDCIKCGLRKLITDFPKSKKWPRYECKSCTSAFRSKYNKTYRQRERVKEVWIEYNKQYKKKWRKRVDIRLHRNVTSVIKDCLNGKNRSREIFAKLGYEIPDLIKHLESQFKDGMSWSNYGQWHIDHIIPRAATPYSSLSDDNFLKCWRLSNLQPLWAIENMRKGNKIVSHPSLCG